MRVIRKFRFSIKEIVENFESRAAWHNFVRRREAELVLSLFFSNRRFPRALEIGAGNGIQSKVLTDYCDHLVCTDLDGASHDWTGTAFSDNPNSGRICYEIVDARDLSRFGDATFDLVFSSNVLEHVDDIDRCLSEIKRVLKPGGVGLHAMPSRAWKTFNMLAQLAVRRRPRVHGVEATNLAEFIVFGIKPWAEKFCRNGFAIEQIIGMPFYFGVGNRARTVIIIGNILGVPSGHFFLTKTPETK